MASPTPVDELAPVVAAACAGNREAFDELVRLTYRDTLQLARRLAGNEQDARDIVQDAYLRAYRGLRRFRGDSRFRTWLFRITVNCASSHASRDRRHRHDQLTADHQAGLVRRSDEGADVEQLDDDRNVEEAAREQADFLELANDVVEGAFNGGVGDTHPR